MFLRTTAVNKILAMKARKRVIQGGTSAGKTYAIIPILINEALDNDRLKITVVAETLPAVKEGALDIFKSIMEDTMRWSDSNWNASTLTYTFQTTKSRIQFKSFDTDGKAKASGKRDILFLNEANHIPFNIADALMIRSKETYIDFNPDMEFWAHTEVLPEHNSEFLLLTYEDNEALAPETLEDLLIKKKKAETSEYWANWWKVYGLGQLGNLQGVVFNNWKQCDSVSNDARYLGTGLDFGFTNDPTAAIDVYQLDGKLVLDEVLYEKGLLNSQIASRLKDKKRTITADSAEPKSIKELSAYGLTVRGAVKGRDSVLHGIQLMQDFELLITARSVNLIKEFRGYSWKTDKTGQTLNQPIDDYNHGIDAARYFISEKFGNKSSGNYSIGGI